MVKMLRACSVRRIFLFSLAVASLGRAGWGQEADSFYLKNQDRVVFYGDSITDQRKYTKIVETFVLTRYPKLNVSFVHSGWGGDTVSGGGGGPIELRLQRDVLAFKPTVMTIMLGMNDSTYGPETEANDKTFFKGYTNIVDTIRKTLPTIGITAIRPSPYDDVTRPPNFPGGCNGVLISFGKWIANYGKEAGLTVADMNTAVVNSLEKADRLDHEHAQEIIPDRVHPSFAGALIMAEQLLKAWGARPTVASLSIDVSKNKPVLKSSEHAEVSTLAVDESGIHWTELDDALPLPFKQWSNLWGGGPVALAIQTSEVTNTLNQQLLRVAGLKDGVYALHIDGESVGAFNNGQLSRGVNLALLDTPMTKQAQQVYDLTSLHSDIHNDRWRSIQVPLAEYALPEAGSAAQELDALERAVVEKQHEAAQPKRHSFTLVPVS
jgi:lysophospholipase L1-like esterase